MVLLKPKITLLSYLTAINGLSIVNKAHQRSSSISRPRNLVGFSLE
jgi:hypothetical protein